MTLYQRRLPHWQPEDAALFVTWRLFGSLPKAARPKPKSVNPPDKPWVLLDRQLNQSAGPFWLKDRKLAACVGNALQFGSQNLNLFKLLAWVIMPNHVHLLIEPKVALSRITMSIKNYTARQCNKILSRTGPFWQDESYDHWVRNPEEQYQIINYIEYNPVEAGPVLMPEDWPWSSATTPKSP